MNYLLSGGYNPDKLELLLSLTSIRSEGVIDAINDHLIKGATVEIAAALNGVDPANVKRAREKLNLVAGTVEKIKEIDIYKKVGKVTDVE